MPASTVYVKPGQHDVVLIPERNMAKLPPEGALVELTPYWRGRLRDGDVIEVASHEAAEVSAAPPAKTPKK